MSCIVQDWIVIAVTLLTQDHQNGPVSDKQAEIKPKDTPAPRPQVRSWRSSLRCPRAANPNNNNTTAEGASSALEASSNNGIL